MFIPKYGYNARQGWRILKKPPTSEIQVPMRLTVDLDMQDTGDVLIDKSGNGNNATCYGDIENIPAPNGRNCKWLTDPNQYISLPSDDSYQTDTFTIEVIYAIDSLPLEQPIVNKQGCFQLRGYDNKLYGLIATTEQEWEQAPLEGITEIRPLIIYHTILLLNGSKRKIFLNGGLEAEEDDTGTLVANDQETKIMLGNLGKIYSYRMWDMGLSKKQIMDLYKLFVKQYTMA